MTDSAAERIDHLRTEIRRLDHRYYVNAVSEVTDLEYDRLLAELKALEQQHPEHRSPDSPTSELATHRSNIWSSCRIESRCCRSTTPTAAKN